MTGKVYRDVPPVDIGIIGGSATLGCRFPDDAAMPGITVQEKDIFFETPHGPTTKFKLCTIGADVTVDGQEKSFLTTRMHGWRPDIPRTVGSDRLFWVLKQAGVKHIISDAGVGAVNPLLDPRDFVVATDFIDLTTQRRTLFVPGYLIIMRRAICPELHSLLLAAAKMGPFPRIINQAVMAVTEGPRWETPAEVRMIRQMGADMVAQSLVPEVHLARQIGACYAQANVVVNHAEGVVQDWEHAVLKAIFEDTAVEMSRVVLRAAGNILATASCGCSELRKPSILQWDEVESRDERQ